jgi:hypothetical protein
LTPGSRLLTAQGVERAVVAAVSLLKMGNMLQVIFMCAAKASLSQRPRAHLAVGVAFCIAGVVLILASVRAGRLHRGAVLLDTAVAIAVVVVAPSFRPIDAGDPWTEWPVWATFLVPVEVCVEFGWTAGTAVAGALMISSWTWFLHGTPLVTRRNVLFASEPYVGFVIAGSLFLHYMRSLAALADARGRAIAALEEERTRHVLQTPHRLLGDLATMLGTQDTNGPRQARIAEVLASVREIEAIVRGTEPASTNLAAELRRVHEQFPDLPVVMDLVEGGPDLTAAAVQRIRETVRELLLNVREHARAGRVVVHAGADADGWRVSVRDDGVGFDPAAARRGMGLGEVTLAELRQIAMEISITSTPGDGTLVELRGAHPDLGTANPAG